MITHEAGAAGGAVVDGAYGDSRGRQHGHVGKARQDREGIGAPLLLANAGGRDLKHPRGAVQAGRSRGVVRQAYRR